MGPMMENTAPMESETNEVPTSQIKAFLESYAEDMCTQESLLLSHLQQMRSFQSRTIPTDASEAFSGLMTDLETLTEGYTALRKKISSFRRRRFADVKEEASESSADTRRRSRPTGARRGAVLHGTGNAPASGSVPANMPGHRRTSPSTETTSSTKQRLWPGQKRTRADDEDGTPQSSDAEISLQKRRRTERDIPGGDEDVRDFIPVAMEKEDISDEVERRLQLKEERRRKWNAVPEKKRKRENGHSAEVIPVRQDDHQVSKRQKATTTVDAKS